MHPGQESRATRKALTPIKALSYCDFCGQPTIAMRGGSCELCGHWQDIDVEEG